MREWLETRQVFDRLDALVQAGQRAALATVVRVRGSAYRREGAKLLVADDGSTVGNVSAGCLEQDVREVALMVIESGGARLRTYCSSPEEVTAWDLGLGCEGRIEIFIEPAVEARPWEHALLAGRTPFAVCTVIGGPDEMIGKRATLTDGRLDDPFGILNGPILRRGSELLRAGQSGLEELHDCTVFIETLVPPPQLVICGAGDDAQPLARFALEVGFKVTVFDGRPVLLAAERFPAKVDRVHSVGDRLFGRVLLDHSCHAVVMTHSFAKDQAYLRRLLTTPVPYIGILGPRQRTERLLDGLRGIEEAAGNSRVYGPVGLDIGTEGAEQVALAVVAEILAVRSGRYPQSLRERVTPIHAESHA